MKISNKIARKSEKNQDCDQHCWVVISGSKRVHVMVLPKRGKGSNFLKSEEKQDKDDFTYQGPSNRSLGGWSHDQSPKMVQKTKVVALHYSFLNLVELCSEVLLLWRYEVKDFEKHRVFFCFLHFSQ